MDIPPFRIGFPLRAVSVLLLAGCESLAISQGPAVAELRLTPAADTMLHPGSGMLVAAAFDVHGAPLEVKTSVVWTSSDPSVAAVSPVRADPLRAIVSTRGAGEAIIRLTIGRTTAEMPLHVFGSLEGPYTARRVPAGASALNDRGEVGSWSRTWPDPGYVTLWSDGETRRWDDPPGLGAGVVTGMNNSGAMLVFNRSTSPNQAVLGYGSSALLADGVRTRIGMVLHGFPFNIHGYDISEEGVVVGSIELRQGNRAIVWMDGETSVLPHVADPEGWRITDSMPRVWSIAVGINERHQIAVNMSTEDWMVRPQWDAAAYVWEAGEYTAIPAPAPECVGWAAGRINNSGAVLLTCGLSQWETAAYLWDGERSIALAPILWAQSLNDRGEVVGAAPDGAYLWRDGQARRFFASHGDQPATVRINNAGQILLSTQNRSYLLDPLP